jgi:hypothetical protein
MSRSVNERARALGPRLAPIALAALLVAGCEGAPGVAGPALLATAEAPMARMARVDVCHRNVDGQYVKISVAEAAYETHAAHGDASVGDPIPGRAGYEFDEECQAQEIQVPDCPCFSATSVADEMATWGGHGTPLLSDQDHEGGFYETILSIYDLSFGEYPLFDAIHLNGTSPYCAVRMSGTTVTSAEAATCRSILLEYGP